jgi:hypothetical protein
MHFDEWCHVPSIVSDLYIRVLTRDGSSVVFFALINQSFQMDEYVWHILGIYQVYSDYIPLFCVPSYNIEGWTLHPATKSFCTLHILIEAIYVFEWMKTRFYSEFILRRYTGYIVLYSWNINGKSIYLVYTWYTWYIPEKNFLGVPDALKFTGLSYLRVRVVMSHAHRNSSMPAPGRLTRKPLALEAERRQRLRVTVQVQEALTDVT